MLGLLIVDHGSRRPAANAQVLDMAARVARLVPAGTPITTAHLDICPPTIADGIAVLLAQGVDELRVLLYFLADGRHVSEDIPAQVRAALAVRPDVRVTLAGALGPDDALAGLMLVRAGLLSQPPAPPVTPPSHA